MRRVPLVEIQLQGQSFMAHKQIQVQRFDTDKSNAGNSGEFSNANEQCQITGPVMQLDIIVTWMGK